MNRVLPRLPVRTTTVITTTAPRPVPVTIQVPAVIQAIAAAPITAAAALTPVGNGGRRLHRKAKGKS